MYGEELAKKAVEWRENTKNQKWKQYEGESDIAISHIQGQQLIISGQIDVTKLLNKLPENIWLDIAQFQRFDPAMCAKQYINTVLIIDKMLMTINEMWLLELTYDVSEWAMRGWTLIEPLRAKKLLIYNNNIIREIPTLLQHIKANVECITNEGMIIHSSMILVELLNRIWRRKMDIYVCLQIWVQFKSYTEWSCKIVQYDALWITLIIIGDINNHIEGEVTCWCPGRPVIDPRLVRFDTIKDIQYTSSGIRIKTIIIKKVKELHILCTRANISELRVNIAAIWKVPEKERIVVWFLNKINMEEEIPVCHKITVHELDMDKNLKSSNEEYFICGNTN